VAWPRTQIENDFRVGRNEAAVSAPVLDFRVAALSPDPLLHVLDHELQLVPRRVPLSRRPTSGGWVVIGHCPSVTLAPPPGLMSSTSPVRPGTARSRDPRPVLASIRPSPCREGQAALDGLYGFARLHGLEVGQSIGFSEPSGWQPRCLPSTQARRTFGFPFSPRQLRQSLSQPFDERTQPQRRLARRP
jgi:hypothetical protein